MYQPDETMAQVLGEMVGLPTSGRNGTSMLFGSVAFALNGEEPLLAVFTPPSVSRAESGTGRLVAVTRTRVVEAKALISGEWGLSVASHLGRDVGLVIKSLAGFDELHVGGGLWPHSEAEQAENVLYGSSVTLEGSRGRFTLWKFGQEWLGNHDQDVLLKGLSVLATLIRGVPGIAPR